MEIRKAARCAARRRAPVLFVTLALAIAVASARSQCPPDTLLATLNNPFPDPNDLFGRAVAIDGNLVVIGAASDDPGGIGDAGRAFVMDAASGALVSTLNNPSPAADDWFGYSVSISGDTVVVGAHLDDPGGIADAGIAYAFDAASGALVSTFNNPSPVASDSFGGSVSVSGFLALIGRNGYDEGGMNNIGIAHVFDVTSGALVATLDNPNPTGGDGFGLAVSLSGNYAVVGAYADSPGGIAGAGAAYVFNAMTGASIATLISPIPAVGDSFGRAVAISGTTIVVGSDAHDPGGISNAGAAFIFDALTGNHLATLANPMPHDGDRFGAAVSISGTRAVVGAYFDDPGGFTDAGSAFAFDALSGALIGTPENPNRSNGDLFGAAVGISGDIAIVGSYRDDIGAFDTGAAYTFTCSALFSTPTPSPDATATPTASGTPTATETPTPSPTLSPSATPSPDPTASPMVTATATPIGTPSPTPICPPDTLKRVINNPFPDADDIFGISVGYSDGLVVIGAPDDNPDGMGIAGTVRVFDAMTGALVSDLEHPGGAGGFGVSVGISGNLVIASGGGAVTVFDATTGAPVSTLSGNSAVAIYGGLAATVQYQTSVGRVFDAATGTQLATLVNPGSSEDGFGIGIAISGDRVAVGAWQYDESGAQSAGRAYVFDALTGNLIHTLPNPFPAPTDFFGRSVAVSDSHVLVGASRDDPGGATDAGAAYIFDLASGSLLHTLASGMTPPIDHLGVSVALSGRLAIAGADWSDPGGIFEAGAACVFDVSTGALLSVLINPAPVSGGHFGESVAIGGSIAVVGASGNDPGGVSNAGSVYIYDCGLYIPTPTPTPAGAVVAVSDGPVDIPNGGGPIDFGSAPPGGPALAKTFTVHNDGGAVLFTANLSIPAPFTLTEPLAFSIPAFGSDTFTIELPTGTPGMFSGNVSFDNSDSGNTPFVFSIAGTIVAPTATPSPTPTATPTPSDPEVAVYDGPTLIPSGGGPVNFGTAGQGGAAPFRIFTVRNHGATQNLFTGAPSVPAGYSVTEPLAFFIPPGGTDNFTVQLSTAAPGTFTGTVSFSTSDPDESVYSFTVTGEISVPTPSATPTPTPSRTATASPTTTPSATATPSPTATITPTPSASASPSPSPSASPTPALPSPSPSVSPSPTEEPILPSPTVSPSAQGSPTPSITPTPTPDTATPTPTATPCCQGDANNSGGAVNAQDFLAVQANFGVDTGVCGQGDANGSGGSVNAQDFLSVQANFGLPCD